MLRFSQDVFAAPLLRPLRQDMEEGAEEGGKCMEDNDGDTWHASNTVRRGLLGADNTIIMSAPPPSLACSSCVPAWSTHT